MDPLKKMPKIEGPELATRASSNPNYSAGMTPKAKDPGDHGPDLANKDHGAKFKLPENVSQEQIRDQSFKYGGGRSSGNRSLATNNDIQKRQP